MKKQKKMNVSVDMVKGSSRKGALMVWNFPDHLRKQLKIFCATNNMTMQEVVKEAVQEYLAR